MTDLKDDLAALHIEREPQRPARRWIPWLVLLIIVAAGGAAAWRWIGRARPIEVQTATVAERAAGTQAAVLNASGYVTARRRATVASKITGKLVEVNVEEGMAVREGQVLARLDDATLKATLALSEAQTEAARRGVRENEVRLNEAKLMLARLTRLIKDGLVTQAELEAAEAQVDTFDARILAAREQVRVAEQQVVLAKTNLDDTVIRAPFSGVAISKDAQPGETVSPVSAGGGFTRTGICTIVDMQSLEIEVDVNEAYINRVRSGQDVSAALDAYPDFPIPARVITTVPTADRQKATVLVRIGFNELDPRILPDMGVKVTFLRDDEGAGAPAARPVALVPKSAIRAQGDQQYAFVVSSNGIVDRRAVKIGGADGDRLEVLAGLTAGERVVVSPPPDLASGTQVVMQ
ncbi:MAG TPA: efflux RND transporter periplasmic adaptor subunit [Vicinamibacterales bacterium]